MSQSTRHIMLEAKAIIITLQLFNLEFIQIPVRMPCMQCILPHRTKF